MMWWCNLEIPASIAEVGSSLPVGGMMWWERKFDPTVIGSLSSLPVGGMMWWVREGMAAGKKSSSHHCLSAG